MLSFQLTRRRARPGFTVLAYINFLPLAEPHICLWPFKVGAPKLDQQYTGVRVVSGGHMNSPSATLLSERRSFSKQATCPSSELLLSYLAGALLFEQRMWVAGHTEACEFCGAELQLLTEHAPTEVEEFTLVDIPLNLRRLAESLLNISPAIETLRETAYEKEGLTLTDA